MAGMTRYSSLSVTNNSPNGVLLRCDWEAMGMIGSSVVDAKTIVGARANDEDGWVRAVVMVDNLEADCC